MIATAHQPLYLPWLGLIHKIASADVFVSFDDVPMEGSGFENRNLIMVLGKPKYLTIPVHRSRLIPIRDVTIEAPIPGYHPIWQRKHFGTLEQGYRGSDHWRDHEPFLRWIYLEQTWSKLVDIDDAILGYMLSYFRLGHIPRFRLSSYGLRTRKDQLVLDMCKKAGAWKYIFGQKGVDYADPAMFRNAGVEPLIQSYSCQRYKQTERDLDFIPSLSAIDAMMRLDRDQAIEVMMAGGVIRRME